MCDLYKAATLVVGAIVETAYVVRHPKRTIRHEILEFRKKRVRRELQRSTDKQRHPSMQAKSPEYRDKVAGRDAEKIVRTAGSAGVWSDMLHPPQPAPRPVRPRGRK